MTTSQLQCSILNAEISNMILNVKKKKSYYLCIKKVSYGEREKCLEWKPEKGKKLAGKSYRQDVCFICD